MAAHLRELAAEVEQTCATVLELRARTVMVPKALEARLRARVSATAARLGVSEVEARRLVEIAILTRGLEALEKDHCKQ
jgi:molybdopterin biosynthesis enzyme